MAITVDYYLTPSSPWTYLGSRIFTGMAGQVGARVNIFPVNFGEIFPVSGGLPLPKRAPQRQAYRLMELARWKRRRGVAMSIQPDNFPATTQLSALAIIAARDAGLDALELSNRLLATLWEDDRNIDDHAVVAGVCASCGFDADAIMQAAADPKTAATFESDTKMAIERGVFGAPTYVIGDELFWGQDRLDFVAEALGIA